MALKGDRYELQTDISFFMDETASRGIIVVHDTAGSGAAMDQAVNNVSVPTGVAGNPAGLLLCDVVNKDLTTVHLNQHKDEVQVGGKVVLLKKGYVLTNNVNGTPAGNGAKAYYQSGGILTETSGSGAVQVGRFLTTKDADGYCKVEINIV